MSVFNNFGGLIIVEHVVNGFIYFSVQMKIQFRSLFQLNDTRFLNPSV